MITPELARTPRMCDECGRLVAKIERVHKGRRFCTACYHRVFKRRMCPKCGNVARLPKDDPEAVCLKCQREKPCARCGKTGYEAGKVTPYGPVCAACAPYFREPEPCEACGRPSVRLTRVSRLGHELRVCPNCARADYGTCEACRRHRLLLQSPDGGKLCKVCLEQGEIPCPSCGKPMSAGYGKRCPSCYWRELLEKRVKTDCAAFSVPAMASHFEAFGRWLGCEVGEHKAALTIHRYLPFFIEIERDWKAVPDYGVLLRHFGAHRLRKALLPMRWLRESGLVMPDAKAKEEDSDRRRIAAALDRVPRGSQERTILDGYYRALMKNHEEGKTTLRSVRLALSPAASLLLQAGEAGRIRPDQRVLDAYLEKTPGQRAAVSGFVRYLREAHGAEIALPKIDAGKVQRSRMRKLEAELLALMREDGDEDEFRRWWLSVALEYFHGLPRGAGKAVRKDQITSDSDGGLAVTLDGRHYWVPAKVPRTP